MVICSIRYRMVGEVSTPRRKRPPSAEASMSRGTWTDAALAALAEGGVDAIRVETLAKKIGVTKGSFYWHFDDRRDLRGAVLDRWEELATSRIIEQVESLEGGDPTKRLRALAGAVFGADLVAARIETALRSWAGIDGSAAQAVERVDARRIDYVARLLRSLGCSPARARRRARLLYRMLIGDFLWRSTGGPGCTPADLDDLVDLLAHSDKE